MDDKWRHRYGFTARPATHHLRATRCQNRRKGGSSVFLAIVLALAWGLPQESWGAGFALVQQGTAAMAQANAFVAEADDPSAIYYNPAGLNQLKRPQVYVGNFFHYPDREFHGSGGYFSETKPRFYESAAFYLAVPVHDRVALGLGVFAPFGLGSDWPATWAGRYIATYTRMKTYNVNPVISLKLLDNLSVAGGLDFLWSDVRMRSKVPVVPALFIDGKSDVGGTGTGVGVNFGVLYEPLKGVKLGFSYRSHIEVIHRGSRDQSLPVAIPGLPTSIDGSAKVVFPPSVTFGISVSRFQPFTFNVDATWTGWSSFDRLAIDLARPIPFFGRLATSLVTEKNWRDAWALRFGVNYQLTEDMKIRAGYAFDMTPVPSGTLEPSIPDSNRHIFAVGGETKFWRLTLGIAYNFILNEGRSKNNLYTVNGVPLPAPYQANGKYESNTHSLGLSMAFRF